MKIVNIEYSIMDDGACDECPYNRDAFCIVFMRVIQNKDRCKECLDLFKNDNVVVE